MIGPKQGKWPEALPARKSFDPDRLPDQSQIASSEIRK
jgi:hypothetical protein